MNDRYFVIEMEGEADPLDSRNVLCYVKDIKEFPNREQADFYAGKSPSRQTVVMQDVLGITMWDL